MSDYLDPNNEELLKDFFAEAESQVDTLESNVLVIENDPTNHDAIDEIFRAAHTLKGGSATVEMTEISSFTHKVEDMLDEIRSDRLQVSGPLVDVLFKSIDVIKAMLEQRANGGVYQEDISELENTIHSYIPEKAAKGSAPHKAPAGFGPSVSAPKAAVAAAQPAAAVTADFDRPKFPEEEFMELKDACEGTKLWCVSVKFDENNPMNSVGGIQVFAALKSLGNVLKTVPDFDALYEDTFYPNVYYYLASDADGGKIEDTAFLSDVTLCTDALLLDSYAKVSSGSAPTAPAPRQAVQAAPAPRAQVAPSPAPAAKVAPPAPKASPVAAPSAPSAAKTAAPADGGKAPSPAAASGHAVKADSMLRVDSKRIDSLLNLVSETVITKAAFNQLSMQLANDVVQFQGLVSGYKEKIRHLMEEMPAMLQKMQEGESSKESQEAFEAEYAEMTGMFDSYDLNLKGVSEKFRAQSQNLGRIAGELQEGVMKIRMVPIGQIFNRFPRVVRDLQRELNKKIELVIEGEDTELDKTVVDDLLNPIMHCVRNSVDHGVEMPADRLKAGKSETGRVLLKAENAGNVIIIEISDDGAGIDVNRVRQKAVEKGLIHPDKVLTDQEAYNLIFMPGFSTASKISDISGRGVGLDVVKTAIEQMKGTITVNSERGKGSQFIIKLPLTLAIIQGLLIRVGEEVYSIPVSSVIESQRVKATEINTIDNYEVLNVRNEVISILRLSRLFGIKNASQVNNKGYCFVVIVGSQEKKIGVMVDALIGEEDVVIKPLSDQFTQSPGIAGASILGDGSVSLIIDVSQLLELGVQQERRAQQAYGFAR